MVLDSLRSISVKLVNMGWKDRRIPSGAMTTQTGIKSIKKILATEATV